MPIIFFVLALLLAMPNATAQSETQFLPFPFVCDANRAGEFPTTDTVFHQILNPQKRQQVTVCSDGYAEFDGNSAGHDDCQRLNVFSFDIVCRGGVLSVPQVALQYHDRFFDYALSGQSLVMLFHPTYPASDRVVGRATLPAGWGPLPLNPLTWEPNHIPLLNVESLSRGQVPVVGVPPRPLQHIDNIFSDTAPIPQLVIAIFMLPSIVNGSVYRVWELHRARHSQRQGFAVGNGDDTMRQLVEPPPWSHCANCGGEMRLKQVVPADRAADLENEVFVCASCGSERIYTAMHDPYTPRVTPIVRRF